MATYEKKHVFKLPKTAGNAMKFDDLISKLGAPKPESVKDPEPSQPKPPTAAEALTDLCACGSLDRWIDVYGGIHCTHCSPIVAPSLVARIERLLADPHTGLTSWLDITPEKPCWDPWCGSGPPKGVWIAWNDTERVRERERASLASNGICRCGDGELSEPCRNSEWIRFYCPSCGKTARIEDAVS